MGKTIKVFEHEYLAIDDDFKHHHWCALGKFNAKHDDKYLTLYPEGVRFKQYVGVIQAGDLTIEVLPKADAKTNNGHEDKERWHKVLLSMLNECKFIKVDYPELANLELRSNSILDVYLGLYVKEIELLLHGGLIKKYRKVEGNQTALKGQLLFKRHVSENIIHRERFYVRNSIYDKCHPLHQILYKALKVVAKVANSVIVKGKAEKLLLDFPEMTDIKIDEQCFQRIILDSKSHRYTKALLISKMILLSYSPSMTGGRDEILALLFDMNKLWEEYVYRQLVKLNQDWKVLRQNSLAFWKPDNNIAKNLRPDIVIENHCKGKVVIDTKWKIIDDEYPSDADLQQMFAYAHHVNSSNLILLYPSNARLKHSGFYLKKAALSGKSQIQCSLLKIPLKWENNYFQGLDLLETDI
jgi:5-methylcytosine-specific restriction enzyme subunit McrC